MPLTLLLALASTAPPQTARPADEFGCCLKDSSSMLGDAQCYATEQERLEAAQKTLLNTLSARLKRPGPSATDYAAAAAALAKAQAAWTAYKDADCEIIDHVFGDGNAAGLAGATCTMDHYATRNAVLRGLLKDFLANR
jgi:uncharacterized protein YecT (DUF1311 family)